MKKLVAVIMVTFMIFTIAGCSSKKSDKSFKVGIVQIVQHDSLDTIRESFTKEIEAEGNVEVVYKNAGGDVALLDSLCQQLVNEKVDVIVAIATPSAQAAAKYADKVPVIFSAVTDPVGAKLVTDPKKPDKNITGTSDEIQVDQILKLAKESYPKTKNIGFIYNSSEANSEANLEKAKAFAKDNNMNVIEGPVSSMSDIQARMQTLVGKVDIIFAPNDNMIASSMDLVGSLAVDAKKPLFVGADSMVKDGGLATIGIDYKALGVETGKITKEVLDGKPVSEIPVVTFKDDLSVYINTKTAESIGFKGIDAIKKNYDNVVEVK